MSGRRHAAIAATLAAVPQLEPGRYTFGGRHISMRSGDFWMEGEAWWAFQIDQAGNAELLHAGELVPVFGNATESSFENSNSTPWQVIISSDPNYCLRDFDATTAVRGVIKGTATWSRQPARY